MGEGRHCYVVGLGSNMRIRGSSPRTVIARALAAFPAHGITVVAASRTMASRPIGPSERLYANAAALVATALDPPALLAALQHMECAFGRVRRGARWRARPLDLDIVLWSGGAWASEDLLIPHPQFRCRPFVLRPAAEVAPRWRDPVTNLTLRQLARRHAQAAFR